MALERKDNIGDTSTTTGTGTLNLEAVAQTGARIFAGNVTSGATVHYDIRLADGSEWEIGEGVFTDGTPDTLTRVTVYASSNAGSLVNFSAGTKNVSLVLTADEMKFFPATSAAPASIDLAEDTDNGTNKITLTAPSAIASDKVITLPDASGILALLETVYPVGSVYTNKTVSTNPATLFGFGTWTAIAGRVVVGLDAGQTEFDTAGETGGAKTHTLTIAELAAHAHTGTTGGQSATHSHTRRTDGVQEYSMKFVAGSSGFGGGGSSFDIPSAYTGNASADHSHSFTSANTGSGNAHNNLQPYVVCYVWERTA